MAVTAQAQSGVLGAAARIVLHGNACPVVESVLEPRITGESAKRSLPKLHAGDIEREFGRGYRAQGEKRL